MWMGKCFFVVEVFCFFVAVVCFWLVKVLNFSFLTFFCQLSHTHTHIHTHTRTHTHRFEQSVRDFIAKVKNRAEEKKAAGEESPLKLQREAKQQKEEAIAEMEEEGEEEAAYSIDPDAPVGEWSTCSLLYLPLILNIFFSIPMFFFFLTGVVCCLVAIFIFYFNIFIDIFIDNTQVLVDCHRPKYLKVFHQHCRTVSSLRT